MKKDKNYLSPDCEIIELLEDSGFAVSATVSNSQIETWTTSDGDDDWFKQN